jgi:hypothetical protein
MKWLAPVGLLLLIFSVSVAQEAAEPADTFDEFHEVFDRVQTVYDNVTTFQEQAYTLLNSGISDISVTGTDTDQINQDLQNSQNFWSSTVPHEINDASRIAIKNIFPDFADAIDSADEVDKWASQAQNDAPQNGTDPESRIDDYFGASENGSAQEGGAVCPVFTGGVCPPCPLGGVMDAHYNCPVPPPVTGLESDGDDANFLAQSTARTAAASSTLSQISGPGTTPSQLPGGITAADLASIGATHPAAESSASPSAEAHQLATELAGWQQQQEAKADAARQSAIRRQRELARQQQEAASAAANNIRITVAPTVNTPPTPVTTAPDLKMPQLSDCSGGYSSGVGTSIVDGDNPEISGSGGWCNVLMTNQATWGQVSGPSTHNDPPNALSCRAPGPDGYCGVVVDEAGRTWQLVQH